MAILLTYIFIIFGCAGSSLLCGFSLVVRSMGYSSMQFAVASRCRVRLQSTRASVAGARRLWSTGSVVVAHGLGCPVACGIFPDQRSNSCVPHWQEDSLPLSHQGTLNGYTSAPRPTHTNQGDPRFLCSRVYNEVPQSPTPPQDGVRESRKGAKTFISASL